MQGIQETKKISLYNIGRRTQSGDERILLKWGKGCENMEYNAAAPIGSQLSDAEWGRAKILRWLVRAALQQNTVTAEILPRSRAETDFSRATKRTNRSDGQD
jgi:hypothetical protein